VSNLNLFAAARAPVRLDVIWAGVTDLGSTTICFATKNKVYLIVTNQLITADEGDVRR